MRGMRRMRLSRRRARRLSQRQHLPRRGVQHQVGPGRGQLLAVPRRVQGPKRAVLRHLVAGRAGAARRQQQRQRRRSLRRQQLWQKMARVVRVAAVLTSRTEGGAMLR